METIEFAASLVSGDDQPENRRVVVALFSITECVAILKCSQDSARELIKAVATELVCVA
jgi:hypothetical protein